MSCFKRKKLEKKGVTITSGNRTKSRLYSIPQLSYLKPFLAWNNNNYKDTTTAGCDEEINEISLTVLSDMIRFQSKELMYPAEHGNETSAAKYWVRRFFKRYPQTVESIFNEYMYAKLKRFSAPKSISIMEKYNIPLSNFLELFGADAQHWIGVPLNSLQDEIAKFSARVPQYIFP